MSSRRLAGPLQLGLAATTIYTAPSDSVGVIQYLLVQNPSASAVTFTMSLGADSAGNRLYDAVSIPAHGRLETRCFYTVDPGEEIQAFAGTATTLVIMLNGNENPAATVFPISVASSGRSLQQANGAPFRIKGDAGWDASTQLTIALWQSYLDQRKAEGYNAVLVELIENYFSQSPPANINGDIPFTGTISGGTPDFTTPNEVYWAFIDRMISEAAARNMLILASSLYQGSHAETPQSQGWYDQMIVNGSARTQSYGSFLGNRYRTRRNLIWVIGGDLSPTSTPTPMSGTGVTILENFTTSILATLPISNITTTHWDGNPSTQFGTSNMWTLNAIYNAGTGVGAQTRAQYAFSPTLPMFVIECYYDGNPAGGTGHDIRLQWWAGILNGANGGVVYGSEWVWPFGVPQSVSNPLLPEQNGPWATHMNDPSTSWFGAMHSTLDGTTSWETLEPDFSNLLVTAGKGTVDTSNYVYSGYTPNGLGACCYLPDASASSITLDLSVLACNTGTPMLAQWIDPTTGSTTTIATYTSGGSVVFTKPGANAAGDHDWGLRIAA